MNIDGHEMAFQQWAEMNESPIVQFFLRELESRKAVFVKTRDDARVEERESRAAIHRILGINDAIEVWQGVGHFLESEAAHKQMEEDAPDVPDDIVDAQSEDALYA